MRIAIGLIAFCAMFTLVLDQIGVNRYKQDYGPATPAKSVSTNSRSWQDLPGSPPYPSPPPSRICALDADDRFDCR